MNRYKAKTEVLYGFHPIFEALNAKRRVIHKLFIDFRASTSTRGSRVVSLAKSLCIKFEFVKSSNIESMSRANDHQGFSALVSPIPIFNIIDIVGNKRIFCEKTSLLVILDGILDPYNFGAIIRTSYCVGALGVIIARDRACLPSPTVSKISAGALEYMPVCCVTNISNTIKILKKEGFWIVGMDAMEKMSSVFDVGMSGPVVVVIGSEYKGLRPLVRRQCDFLVSVPMKGQLNSLNASVAAAVVLYENFRQRQLVSKKIIKIIK